jgi:hypothetical protein
VQCSKKAAWVEQAADNPEDATTFFSLARARGIREVFFIGELFAFCFFALSLYIPAP